MTSPKISSVTNITLERSKRNSENIVQLPGTVIRKFPNEKSHRNEEKVTIEKERNNFTSMEIK